LHCICIGLPGLLDHSMGCSSSSTAAVAKLDEATLYGRVASAKMAPLTASLELSTGECVSPPDPKEKLVKLHRTGTCDTLSTIGSISTLASLGEKTDDTSTSLSEEELRAWWHRCLAPQASPPGRDMGEDHTARLRYFLEMVEAKPGRFVRYVHIKRVVSDTTSPISGSPGRPERQISSKQGAALQRRASEKRSGGRVHTTSMGAEHAQLVAQADIFEESNVVANARCVAGLDAENVVRDIVDDLPLEAKPAGCIPTRQALGRVSPWSL